VANGEPHLERRQSCHRGSDQNLDGDGLLSSKLNSHGVEMSHSPATKLSHSSQTAKAVSAAIDSTAIKSPMIDAVCRGAPADRLNSQGEKNRVVPKEKFTMSQRLSPRPLIHSSRHPGWLRRAVISCPNGKSGGLI
jgi:hypothetical protein